MFKKGYDHLLSEYFFHLKRKNNVREPIYEPQMTTQCSFYSPLATTKHIKGVAKC